ncbi:MAG: DUF4012 domain-containing protein [Burkholderiaceae bacterium]|nr:DUF4012 domain-containing protein [Microbacteriaceae bacterium]
MVILFLVALVAATVWVGARSLLAKNELEATVPLAEKVKAALIAGDQSATGASIVELANHARAASALTSDPIYAIAQSVPFVGPNLTAFRQVTVTIDHIIGTGLLPLASLAVTFEAGTLGPVDGAFQVQPLIDAAPTLETADRIMREAQRDLAAIDTSATIGAVTDAVARVDSVVNNAAVSVATASNVATLLPAMLGTTEDRTYLLMFQNNAEVRATGGLPGALAIVNTSKGRFSLGEQSSATKFPHYPAPVLPLDRATASLHPEVGQFMQDVNETPDFPTAAALAREMWRREKGVSVDGVISIDPVALSYILKATGPVTVSTGDVLDSKTVVDFLLSGVYAKYPDPVTQDSVFADAAQAVFSAIATGSLDQGELRDALAKASSERRILIWNTREAEQKVLAGTHFAGTLPKTNAGGDLIGVYLNDASGAKMDYYLDAATTVTSGADPGSYRADVAVSSSAPADAATSLSAYVTGGGVYGVPPGSVRTRVLVYGPVGSHVTATRLNGVPVEAQVEQDFGRGVAQVIVQLAPGEVATVSVDLEGASSPSSGEAAVRMTPLIREGKVIINAPTEP